MKRRNCWEIKECGREPGGENVQELGICPAAIPSSYDGMNGGKHGGRLCWVVTGTFNKDLQEKDNKSLGTCIDCNVLREIRGEEGRCFVLIPMDYN